MKKDAGKEFLKGLKDTVELTTGERRSESYSKRVKQWWNSKLHGAARWPEMDGPERVLCVVTCKETGRVVARAEGRRTRKRSAYGAARVRAVSVLFDAAGERLGDLDGYEFTYEKLEG